MNAVYRPYIQPLIQAHRQRGVRSALSLLGISNDAMRARLAEKLGAEPGTRDALLADPLFEATFGWREAMETLSDLPSELLHPRLRTALASPPKALAAEYAFPGNRHPYTHQLEAWKTLAEEPARSLVVTSGTGSGKTECFLLPILNRLAHQSEREGRLQGVRALFIYPLNALIASQQSRLDAWTDEFNGALRYCLYTGNLPSEAKESEREGFSGRVIDRKELRKSAPPMLITNATMLEYMLIRRDDAPILEQSQGKLEWIVLDEAHTHMGSQAAEMALLLRRTMDAFGVKPETVRFVATSATFGNDSETTEKLRNFLSSMAGVSPNQVHVVHGSRSIPGLIQGAERACELEALTQIDPSSEISAARYQALALHPVSTLLRRCFVDGSRTIPRKLSELAQATGLSGAEVLNWLDVMSGTRDESEQVFLPLRVHLFHNVLSTIGCCANPECTQQHESLRQSEDWLFGELYTDGRVLCDCGAPVLPIAQCMECSELFLRARQNGAQLSVPTQSNDDGFTLNLDQQDDDDSEQHERTANVLVTNRHLGDTTSEAWLNLKTHQLSGNQGDSSARLILHEGGGECPCCESSHRAGVLRRMGVGAPFTLSTVISTLLEFCPEDGDDPMNKPFRGRKLISFTDSRQGTARIAVKLQQDAERAFTRSFIYHCLLKSVADQGLKQNDQEELKYYRNTLAQGHLLQEFQRNRLQELIEREATASVARLTWADLKNKVGSDTSVKRELLDYYSQLSNVFGQDDSALLAEMLLLAEFCRRPKRQNSLETMGLVRVVYPALAHIKTLPQAWPRSGNAEQDQQDWRDYLKVLLDFYVRENSFVRFSRPEFSKLIGQKINLKILLPPTSQEKESSGVKRWPQIRLAGRDKESGDTRIRTQQARPIQLLLTAFGWTVASHRTAVDSILAEAWRELVEQKLLSREGAGFALTFDKIELHLTRRAAVCPVTRRFIDTPFKARTPYQSRTRLAGRTLEWHDIPVYNLPFGGALDVAYAIAAAREWLDTTPSVCALREQGLWSDLHDRIVEGARFFRAVEHSAQQSATRLRRYEGLFKAGKINVMSCSTTMEMGVDIGGITVVAMNNVPPHPANYLQRAGRAGRRREGRSVAMTVCKRTAHDQAVFAKPDWPFTKKVTIPSVAFNSPDLVQRHVNAYLLSRWMKRHLSDTELTRFTAGSFFHRSSETSDHPQSVAERFMMWCASSEKHLQASPELASALDGLIRGTVLEHAPLFLLIEQCRDQIGRIADEWCDAIAKIEAYQAAVFGNDAGSVAIKAIEMQKNRLFGEYLLSELATKRFLPGYGFPSDIVPFDNLTLGQLKKTNTQKQSEEREDNRGRYRQLASRDRGTALREYAPGAEVVMDGLVYRAAGVTLNWHVPASENAAGEVQEFKYAWRCTACGASGNARVSRPEHCELCEAKLESQWVKLYLVPAGFAVDLYVEPHTDISQPAYVPAEQPWLSVDTIWQPLLNPDLGLMRSSASAPMFLHNSGSGRNGFAICLECGRAEPMLSIPDNEAPSDQQFVPRNLRVGSSHRRLRGAKGRNDGESTICPGSDNAWKIKTGIHLGHDAITDACELVLKDGMTGHWLEDEQVAYSLVVALRTVLASRFGVQEDELGCTTRPILMNGSPACALQIFDVGSAGYASQAEEQLRSPSLWQAVSDQLGCTSNCASACEHCLITFDTQHHVDLLDRHKAKSFLENAWLHRMSLPEQFKLFGPVSELADGELAEAIRAFQMKQPGAQVVFWPEMAASEWDLPAATGLLAQLRRSLLSEYQVALVLPEDGLAGLDDMTRLKLAALADLGLQLFTTRSPRFESDALRLAALARTADGSVHGWAVEPTCSILADQSWGDSPDGRLVIHGELGDWPRFQLLDRDELLPTLQHDQQLDLQDEFDGKLQGFGERLWKGLSERTPRLAGLLEDSSLQIVAISYSDRYLKSPLVTAILLETIHALGKTPAGENGLPLIRLATDPIVRHTQAARSAEGGTVWSPRYRHHDWHGDNELLRQRILKGVFEYAGMEILLDVGKCQHARELTLKFSNESTVRIRFDQGVSYWAVAGKDPYDFERAENEQIDAIANMQGHVCGKKEHPTQVYIKF